MPCAIFHPAIAGLRRALAGVRAVVRGLVHCAACAGAAQAQGWSSSLLVASEKVVRGVSQSDGDPAMALDVSHSSDTGLSFAAGLAAPVYKPQGGEGELSFAVSQAWQRDADWLLQLGAARYQYVGSARARERSYGEINLSAGWRERATVSISLLPDAAGYRGGQRTTGFAAAYEVGAQQRLPAGLALDLGLGYFDLQQVLGGGYVYGSVGLSGSLGPLRVYGTWIDSQAGDKGLALPSRVGERWVLTLVWPM